MPCSFTMESIGETSLTAALVDIARRVETNVPAHGNPERFHIEKSEIVADLKRIAREVAVG